MTTSSFRDLGIMHRFFFAGVPEVVFVKTSGGTYSPTYNESDIRFVMDSTTGVCDLGDHGAGTGSPAGIHANAWDVLEVQAC